jgi:hypothetical protein
MTASKLILDAETAASLGCKPGDTKTLELTVSIPADFDSSAGGEIDVTEINHYEDDEYEEEEETPAPEKPAVPVKKTSRPPAIDKMIA